MAENRFKIVFEKLKESTEQDESGKLLAHEVELLAPELDEIGELKRLVADVSEPDPLSYTST